jgi:hypothetical protein
MFFDSFPADRRTMGIKNSASRTAAATAARHGRGALDMDSLAVEDSSKKARPKPRKKPPRSENAPTYGEVDPSLVQRQEVSNELETHGEDNSGDISHSNVQDDNRSGSVNGDLNGDLGGDFDGDLGGDFDGDLGGDFDGDHDHGNGYSCDNSVSHNGGHGGNGDHSGGGVGQIPDQRNNRSWPAPALDEYGSEPEQYSQQDGECIPATIVNTHSR